METKQHTIAEFKSKVIQAKSEGTESESAMKKKSPETSINTGQGDISDTGKNPAITTHSHIHTDRLEQSSLKNNTEQAELGNLAVTSDASENKKKTVVNLEKGNIAIDNNQKLPLAQSKLKAANDNSASEKMQQVDNKTKTTDMKKNINETAEARADDASEQTFGSTTKEDPTVCMDSVQPSTPNRRISDAKDVEPVITTLLPDCSHLNSSSAPAFVSAAKSTIPSGK